MCLNDSTGKASSVVFYNDNILNFNDRPENAKYIYLKLRD